MLTSINPLGERGRNQRFAITAGAYVTASTVAGAALGTALGAAGAPLAAGAAVPAAAAVAAAALAGLLLDARVLGVGVPGPRRQVNEDWLVTYRGWVYGAGFGAQLGLAFVTIVAASITWVAFACALAAGSPAGGLLVGATFGLARAVPVLAMRRVADPGALRARIGRLDGARPRVFRALTAVQAVAGIGLALMLAGRVA
jgi:hypothetical protein